jgi:hypothetical protein
MGQMEEVRWSWLRADPLEDVSVLPRKGNDIDLLRSHSLPSPCHIRQLSLFFCGEVGRQHSAAILHLAMVCSCHETAPLRCTSSQQGSSGSEEALRSTWDENANWDAA